ncbi:MAG: hypothetical protein CL435_04835 [Acidimicrobiaceae bacterium]|nr:hypothetical protein [Acidimicrobiaceae bacterium]
MNTSPFARTGKEPPPWRIVDLPGRGPLRLRDSGQPDEEGSTKPALLLIHGWTVSADLNWGWIYPELTRRFRVLAWDQRGHGTNGIRSYRQFRLEDCADDAAAVIDALGVEGAIAVGYSMGGAIAQLLWARHPHMVSGLLLCASATRFRQTIIEYRDFALIRLACGPAALLPETAWVLAERVAAARSGRKELINPDFDKWATKEIRAGDLGQILQAGVALGGFDSSDWACDIDVPTVVLIGVGDNVVPTARQRQLAASLPKPFVVEFSGNHAAPVVQADHFSTQLITGIDWLEGR